MGYLTASDKWSYWVAPFPRIASVEAVESFALYEPGAVAGQRSYTKPLVYEDTRAPVG